eukprot:m.508781 g.508781  ORF g.508781 m.508781 type:complete len:54 (-) comp21886_c0_seq2:169-330(-)
MSCAKEIVYDVEHGTMHFVNEVTDAASYTSSDFSLKSSFLFTGLNFFFTLSQS